MKGKSFLLTALVASMTFVACDNNDNEMGQLDNTPKSVTIKLANLQKNVTSRSLDENVTSNAAQLNNFTIFFVDGAGNFHDGYAATDVTKDVPLDRDFNAGDDIPTFHYLDASVTKVIVVGNPTWAEDAEPTDETALKALTAAVANLQNVEDLVLVGEENLVKNTQENENVPGHTEAYKAEVSILPLIARLEISAFEYLEDTDGGRDYDKIAINQVAVNNYYGTTTFANANSDLVNATIDKTTIWPYLENLGTGWFNDELADAIKLDNTNQYKHDMLAEVTTENPTANVFAYNVPAGIAVPQVIVRLTGTKETKETPLYLATRTLNGADNKFQAGYIYRMNAESPFSFKDTDLGNPDKCVDVTVEVKPWTVVAVTPEF